MACGYKLNFMLTIRFQRVGRKNDPAFRVVVGEKRSKPKSGELEILGSYHPKTKATILKGERILYWLSKGAKASPTVHNLLVSKDVIKGIKVNVVNKPVAESLKVEEVKDEVVKEQTPEEFPESVKKEEPVKMEEEKKESVPEETAATS